MTSGDVLYAWGQYQSSPSLFWSTPRLVPNAGTFGAPSPLGAVTEIDSEASYWIFLIGGVPYGLGDNTDHAIAAGSGVSFTSPAQCCSSGGVPFSPGWASTGSGTIIQVDGGNHGNWAVDSAGAVFGWGDAENGCLGNNLLVPSTDTTNGTAPPDVTTPAQVLGVGGTGHLALKTSYGAVTSGQTHMVGLLSTGRVVACGTNQYGECGNGVSFPNGASSIPPLSPTNQTGSPANYPYTAVPVNVLGGAQGGTNLGDASAITKISAGNHHTLALDTAGNVYAWGLGTWGQLGQGANNSSSVPVLCGLAAAGATMPIIDINAGGGLVNTDGQSYALDSAGVMWGWGANTYGQLALGTPASHGSSSFLNTNVPVQMQLAAAGAATYTATPTNGINKCFLGTRHGGFLDANGILWMWGSNFTGAVGLPGLPTGDNTAGSSGTSNTSVAKALTVSSGTINKLWMGNQTSMVSMTITTAPSSPTAAPTRTGFFA